MIWNELLDKVKYIEDIEIRAQFNIAGNFLHHYIYYNGLCFMPCGGIECDVYNIANHRTPDQMYAIITALTETKE